ncbi:hypothetical protein ANCCEY_10200 [Ancylostoma ceylanicum]|uniref:G-protein coupled receptors family 1 profile domain-containing protein n=1 Tax=Ancylostoma ceylanicum TaxID=53326 RepID=A0A0D6LFH4_9BILA|nr:hypothetical protein ANCCEY_10200 [Ancylostoma ceylanicum]
MDGLKSKKLVIRPELAVTRKHGKHTNWGSALKMGNEECYNEWDVLHEISCTKQTLVPCIANDETLSSQICPTDIRLDPAYYAIYYTYMYTTFLAIGPLALLILLNVCVVFTVITKGSESDESDTMSLILVVFFFIFCNFTALLVNFMEIILNNPILSGFWEGEAEAHLDNERQREDSRLAPYAPLRFLFDTSTF